MSAQKLKRLQLAYFRGASGPTSVEFDSSKKITMIFGENGTGKSSIVDAFSFICGSELGSIADRSGADKRFVTSIAGKPNQLQVIIETDAGKWMAKLNGAKIDVSPTSGFPDVRVLRRGSILKLVDAQPSERYKALEQYIAVPGVTKSEASLRAAANDAKNALEGLISSTLTAEETLERTWQSEGRPEANAITWALKESQKDTKLLEDEVASINALLSLVARLDSARATREAAAVSLAAVNATLGAANAELKAAENISLGSGAALASLLQQARDYVAANITAADCPVCTQPIGGDDLLKSLNGRLSVMTQLQNAVAKVNAENRKAETAKNQLDTGTQAYLIASTKLAEALKVSTLQCTKAVALPMIGFNTLLDANSSVDVKLPTADAIAAFSGQLISSLETARDAAQKSVNLKGAITSQLSAVRDNRKRRDRANAVSERLRATLEVVEGFRKQFVITVLTEISAEVSALYAHLHPNEPLGGVQLKLDERRIGSLELFSNFYGQKDITPQSLYSESHLDTLGFCVFFALAKKYKTEHTVIVLDDVLTSVDADHLDRFIDMLHEQSQYFGHIVITTHYRPWRDRYRNQRAPAHELHFIELRGWSLSTGIRQQSGLSAIAELKAALNGAQFDRQAIASKSGVLLESILEFLAVQFGCRMSRKPAPTYTLRELSDCFKKELLAQLKVEQDIKQSDGGGGTKMVTITTELGPIINTVKGLAIIRNEVGGHFNIAGASVTDAEVETLGKLAVQLGESLVCPTGGDLPAKKDTNMCWRSRKGSVRLFPLTHP